MRVRIGTYNLAMGKTETGNVTRLDSIVAKIRSMRCDLLGLQEMRRYLTEDPARDLTEGLRQATEAHYPHAREGITLIEKTRCNMVLSRFEIVQSHSFLISDFKAYGGTRDTEPRHLLLVLVKTSNNTQLYFGTTHLHTRRDRADVLAADERKRQCERILAIIHDLPGLASTPLLLAGDFNNNPYLKRSDPEPEIDLLRTELNDLSIQSGDTRCRRDGSTVRIDRVFGNRLVSLVETHRDEDLLGAEEIFMTEDGFPLSDHRPVVVSVDVDTH